MDRAHRKVIAQNERWFYRLPTPDGDNWRNQGSAASKFARASGEVKLAVDSIAQPCVWSDTY